MKNLTELEKYLIQQILTKVINKENIIVGNSLLNDMKTIINKMSNEFEK